MKNLDFLALLRYNLHIDVDYVTVVCQIIFNRESHLGWKCVKT